MLEILLDTSILMDFFMQREDFYKEADAIMQAHQANKFMAYITSNAPLHFYNDTQKLRGEDKIQRVARSLLQPERIIPITEFIRVASSMRLIEDYDAAVQVESAIVKGLDGIVARNISAFKNSPIPVYDPVTFLKLL